MDFAEIDELFDDNDEEIWDYLNNLRTYQVKERINHFQQCTDEEFVHRFRFSKNTVATKILPEIEHLFIHDTPQYVF